MRKAIEIGAFTQGHRGNRVTVGRGAEKMMLFRDNAGSDLAGVYGSAQICKVVLKDSQPITAASTHHSMGTQRSPVIS